MALTVLLGGARSGKSALALRLASSQHAPRVFIATAEALDDEMAERIGRHRAERGSAWSTVEEPADLTAALGAVPADACVVVDCLSLWIANLMERGLDDADVLRLSAEAGDLAAGRPGVTIAVSNEVGMGVVPVHELGRRYRDGLGRVNAAWVARSADARLVVAGRTLALERVP
jgi:adenosylcobinamide kinase / adenosylcobinamide-phosphate guanylyltransferase